MGDVATQPLASDHNIGSSLPDLGRPVGAPGKMARKSLGVGDLEHELAQTPCHGRKASRGGGSVLVVKPQGAAGLGVTWSEDFPVKVYIASRLFLLPQCFGGGTMWRAAALRSSLAWRHMAWNGTVLPGVVSFAVGCSRCCL